MEQGDFKAVSEGNMFSSMDSVVGHDRKQPGCHSGGVPQKGPKGILSPWNCSPSHHPPCVLARAAAEA